MGSRRRSIIAARRPEGDLVPLACPGLPDRSAGRAFSENFHMKALFLGGFATTVAPRILAKVKTALETEILADESDAARLAPLFADADIVVGHIWRNGFPPAPRLRLLQSVAAGLDLLDLGAVPKGVTVCNVFGHEPAIAGSDARWPIVRPLSGAVSLRPTAARSPSRHRPRLSFRSPNSTICCRFATR